MAERFRRVTKAVIGTALRAQIPSLRQRERVHLSLAVFLSKEGASSRFIKPGSPWQNGFAESFVSTLRRDLLDVEVFDNLLAAQIKLVLYLCYYNEERPHSSLRYGPPAKAMSESQKTYY